MRSNSTPIDRSGAAAVSRPGSPLFFALIVLFACGVTATLAIFAARLSGSHKHPRPAPELPHDEASERPIDRDMRATSAMAPDRRSAATFGSASVALPSTGMPPQPPPPKTAREEREQMISQLRASGASREPWTAEATTLFQALEPVMDPKGLAEQSKIECFHDGCVRTTTFGSVAESEASLQAIKQFGSFLYWPGIKSRTGSEHLPDGKVANAIFLYRPEEAHNTL